MSVANHENSRRPIFSSLFLNFIRQLLIKFFGFFILLFAFMILIIMFSYDTKDPSFRSSTSDNINNLLGSFGSNIADPLHLSLGISYFAIILILVIWSWRLIFNINNSPIDRPPTKEVLKNLLDNQVNLILTNETDVFNNYLKTKKIVINNEIKILKTNDKIPNNSEKYWFLCLNNVLHFVGDKGLLSNNPKVEKKCLNVRPKNQFYEIFPSISNIQDFYIRRFEKNVIKK